MKMSNETTTQLKVRLLDYFQNTKPKKKKKQDFKTEKFLYIKVINSALQRTLKKTTAQSHHSLESVN